MGIGREGWLGWKSKQSKARTRNGNVGMGVVNGRITGDGAGPAGGQDRAEQKNRIERSLSLAHGRAGGVSVEWRVGLRGALTN